MNQLCNIFSMYQARVLLVLLLLQIGCTKSTIEDQPSVCINQITSDKKVIESMGYNTSELIHTDSCYIVEGDICISNEHLNDVKAKLSTRHTYVTIDRYTVRKENRTIRIAMEGAESSDKEAVLSALKYWNEEIQCGLYFVEEYPANITIKFLSASNTQGSPYTANIPTIDGKPGSVITIYNNTQSYFFADKTQKKYLIVHTIGHAVGFGHTPATLEEYYTYPLNYHINATIDFDPTSIMVKYSTPLKWSGADDWDKKAFRNIYPYDSPILILSCSPYEKEFQCNKEYTLRAEYKNDPKCPNPEFRFSVDSDSEVPAVTKKLSNNVMSILFPVHGTYRINTTITNATPVIDTTFTVAIYDKIPSLSISPNEPVEIGKDYQVTASYDNPDAGNNPVYNFTVIDTRFGNKANIRRIDNKSANIVFPAAGQYLIKASLASNPAKSCELNLPVESREITLSCSQDQLFSGIHSYYFSAHYFSALHPDPKFKFTITSSLGDSSAFHFWQQDNKTIQGSFYKAGKYTVRVEIEGAPEIYKESSYYVSQDYPELEFHDLEEPIFTSQRITFRAFWEGDTVYDGGKVKIEVIDTENERSVPFFYEEGFYRYYFFADNATDYRITVTSTKQPAISSEYMIHTEPGVYLKLIPIYEKSINDNIDQRDYTIYFYSDRECTQRITSLQQDMQIRVHLFKKAVELYPTATLLYRDEVVAVGAGESETCRFRLTTIHERLPSGEMLNDYYEIEFLRFD